MYEQKKLKANEYQGTLKIADASQNEILTFQGIFFYNTIEERLQQKQRRGKQ